MLLEERSLQANKCEVVNVRLVKSICFSDAPVCRNFIIISSSE